MATMTKDTAGRYLIGFYHADGQRKWIRTGTTSERLASRIKSNVESILEARASNMQPAASVAAWLNKLPPKLRAKLAKAGLIHDRGEATMKQFTERYAAALSTKAATKTFYSHTLRNLRAFFGNDRSVRSIEAADADAFRHYLVNHEQLAPATAGRRIVAARTIWRKAIRWKLSSQNPFEGIRGGGQVDVSRRVFVKAETIEKIIASTPDLEWRVVIALARYAGLRTPSETFLLKWTDVDWEKGQIRVLSPKTEHREGHGSRLVPLFPELHAPLLALFAEAEPGTQYVVHRLRSGCRNLGPQFKRIVRHSGEIPWPKLFHNLRASRESELMREYGLATACKWIGNSPAVAARHYAMSVDLDADFRRATGLQDSSSAVAKEAEAIREAHRKAHRQGTERAENEGQRLPDGLPEKSPFPKKNSDCRELHECHEDDIGRYRT